LEYPGHHPNSAQVLTLAVIIFTAVIIVSAKAIVSKPNRNAL
jgi:hypothetical protein